MYAAKYVCMRLSVSVSFILKVVLFYCARSPNHTITSPSCAFGAAALSNRREREKQNYPAIIKKQQPTTEHNEQRHQHTKKK